MKNLYTLVAFFIFSLAFGQVVSPTEIDHSYNYKANILINSSSNFLFQPDGKIFTIINGSINNVSVKSSLVRLNSDLSLDETFPIGKFSSVSPVSLFVSYIAQQSDGKILAYISNPGNTAVKYNDIDIYDGLSFSNQRFLIRLNQDGTLDNSFDSYNIGKIISKFEIASDGIILVHTIDKMIERLDANGNFLNQIHGINNFWKLPDGRLFALKEYTNSLFYLSQINSDGQNISSFINLSIAGNNYSVVFGPINDLKAQSDGKILIAGPITHIDGVASRHIVRFNTNGTLDTSFNIMNTPNFGLSVTPFTPKINSIAIQPDGKILAGGDFDSYNGISAKGLIRFNTDLSVDTTLDMSTGFDIVGDLPPLNIFSISNDVMFINTSLSTSNVAYYKGKYLLPRFFKMDNLGNLMSMPSLSFKTEKVIKDSNQNTILIGGGTYASNRGLKLNDLNGNIIDNVNLRMGFDNYLNWDTCFDAIMQPDGKIIVGGRFHSYNGSAANKIIRLNQDYSIDNTFQSGSGFNTNAYVGKLSLQSDGKILVGGSLGTTYDGNAFIGTLIRLNSNGTFDSTYNINAQFQGDKFITQSTGKVISVDSNGLSALVRLNVDGTIDNTFVTNFPIGASVIPLLSLENDKMLVKHIYQILRLNSDGSTDTTFIPIEVGNNNITAIYSQPDGRILINERYYDGFTVSYKIVRYNIDSTKDLAFESGFFNSYINHISMDSNGRIFVAGEFNRYNGAWCNGTMRLLGGEAYLAQGTNRFDSNNNGCDINDILYPFLKFKINYNGVLNDYIANSSGNYAIPFSAGSHTITPTIENPSYFNISPANIFINFPGDPSPYTQNICIEPNGYHPDLEISILPITPARPGFDAKYKLVYKNKGNQFQSGSITLNFNDAVLDYISGVPAASTTATNVRTWNFTNLKPCETREVLITLNLNSPVETPPLNGGSVLNYTATITSAQIDDTPNDNTFAFNQGVVNSYDPNDKTCLQGTTVGLDKVGEYVHYVIRFENTGTYAAQNITVKDVIDTDKFDINTLIPLNGSHLFTTKISEGNKVEFYFQNINLPFADATNDGYLAFKIKTKSTLVSGDTFGGLANIFFDYNSAITTNTYTTTIQALSIKDFSFENYFSLYPNPVSDILNIDKKEDIEISSIHIYNVMGQLMMVIPNAKNISTLDVSTLSSGNYFVKINTDKGTSNTKFIKR